MKPKIPQNIHSQIKKAQSSLILIVAVATVITVFCLVSTRSLLNQGSYQRHVINARHTANSQLKKNLASANQLTTAFKSVFENNGPINIIGGKNDPHTTAVPPDGSNSRIVLDALPSTYDFPALVTSLSKILGSATISNASVGGSDQSSTASNEPTGKPQPIEIDIPLSGTSSVANLQKLLSDLQRSVRPYDITSMQITGNNSTMTFSLQAHTYYQPPKAIDVGSKVLKE